jgi:hypothetical protein
MKRILTVLALIAISVATQAQGNQAVNKASMETPVHKESLFLKETSYDFGKIPQNRPVTHEFEVVNTSSDSLKLENVQASCGCTTPIWKKDPVAPGASTTITVGYNAAAEGNFEKTVSIYYNGGQMKILNIKGNVYKLPATSAPANSSIELLKKSNK